MQAIIKTGGKQYVVSPGETLRVEKLAGEIGAEIELPVAAVLQEGVAPVSGGSVKATIVGEGRGDKILVFKFKHKKQYKKTIGHRQPYSEIKIGDVVA
jgi:large subunit ribosomal protein L21